MAELAAKGDSVGERLRRLRLGRGLSQTALASVIGCDKALISRFESGTGALGREKAKAGAEYFDNALTRDEIIYAVAAKKPVSSVPTKKPVRRATARSAN
jgi:transcriptional regulator with XRE-family HTH domain